MKKLTKIIISVIAGIIILILIGNLVLTENWMGDKVDFRYSEDAEDILYETCRNQINYNLYHLCDCLVSTFEERFEYNLQPIPGERDFLEASKEDLNSTSYELAKAYQRTATNLGYDSHIEYIFFTGNKGHAYTLIYSEYEPTLFTKHKEEFCLISNTEAIVVYDDTDFFSFITAFPTLQNINNIFK